MPAYVFSIASSNFVFDSKADADKLIVELIDASEKRRAFKTIDVDGNQMVMLPNGIAFTVIPNP